MLLVPLAKGADLKVNPGGIPKVALDSALLYSAHHSFNCTATYDDFNFYLPK